MRGGTKIGVVTAAGYTEEDGAEKYYGRLHGLLDAIKASPSLTDDQRENFVVMGGESNFLFKYSSESPHLLEWVPRRTWILEEMKTWTEFTIQALLDKAEEALRECVHNLHLPAMIIRKDRAVGIVPTNPSTRFARESLEETVLVVSKIIEMSSVSHTLPFCAFNGGNDVFVDIGDKSWGVLVCQKFFGTVEGRSIEPKRTIHVGDQFLSANGANDFRARRVGTTAWVASPAETVELLEDLGEFLNAAERKRV
jgi:IMP and pyridine-specific 5'-nucleotidase